MLDIGTVIRTGWYNAMHNTIGEVRIFDEYDLDKPSSPYIVLSTQTEQQVVNDGTFLYNCTIAIKVVAFDTKVVGKITVENIGNKILALISDARTGPFTLPDPLVLMDTKLIGTNTMPMQTDGRVYITKIFRFHHIVSQTF